VYVSVCASIAIRLSVLIMVLYSDGTRDWSVAVTMGWTAEVRFPAEAIGFSLLYSVQIVSLVHNFNKISPNAYFIIVFNSKFYLPIFLYLTFYIIFN
jgi:hypothetical protein